MIELYELEALFDIINEDESLTRDENRAMQKLIFSMSHRNSIDTIQKTLKLIL